MKAWILISALSYSAELASEEAREDGHPVEARDLDALQGDLEALLVRHQAELRRLEVPVEDAENLTALIGGGK